MAGPFYLYGSSVAAALLLSLLLMEYIKKKYGLKQGTVSWFAVLALPLGFLLARAGWCLSSVNWLKEQGVLFFFQFQKGGYMLYGALAGALLAALLTAKITGQRAVSVLDAAAAPAALTVCLGRLAESLVGQGYGRGIEDWFDPYNAMSSFAWEDPSPLFRFPLAQQNYYGTWNFAVFLPEALMALAIFLILLLAKRRAPGAHSSLALLLYAVGQILFESMRMDAVLKWGFVRVSQLLSALAVAAVLLICCLCQTETAKKRFRIPMAWAGVLLLCGIMILMEFALEQKIAFLSWMYMDVCYLVMSLSCLGLLLIVLPLWKKAFPKLD